MNFFAIFCVQFLLLIVSASEEQHDGVHHQDALDTFSTMCCPKGLFLQDENNTCVHGDGSESGEAINSPHCPNGMFMLNPNANRDDVFMEKNGDIELIIIYDEDADSFVENGS